MTNYKLLKQRLKRLISRRLPGATGRDDGTTWRIHLDMPVPDIEVTPATQPPTPLPSPTVTIFDLLGEKGIMPPPEESPEESEFLIVGGVHVIKMGEEIVVVDPTDFLLVSREWKVVDPDQGARQIVRIAPVLRLSGVVPGKLRISGEEAGLPSAGGEA